MAVATNKNYQFYRKYLFQLVQMYKNRADVRAFLEIILSLGTIIVFGVFAIRPTVITIASLITEIESKVETDQKLETKILALTEAQVVYDRERARTDLLLSAVPDNPALQDYIKQIEVLANEQNVTMELMSVKNVNIVGGAPIEISEDEALNSNLGEKRKTKIDPAATEISFEFSVSGNYANLQSYLKLIEQARRPYFMDSLTIGSVAAVTNETIILTMKGRLAYLAAEQQ